MAHRHPDSPAYAYPGCSANGPADGHTDACVYVRAYGDGGSHFHSYSHSYPGAYAHHYANSRAHAYGNTGPDGYANARAPNCDASTHADAHPAAAT